MRRHTEEISIQLGRRTCLGSLVEPQIRAEFLYVGCCAEKTLLKAYVRSVRRNALPTGALLGLKDNLRGSVFLFNCNQINVFLGGYLRLPGLYQE